MPAGLIGWDSPSRSLMNFQNSTDGSFLSGIIGLVGPETWAKKLWQIFVYGIDRFTTVSHKTEKATRTCQHPVSRGRPRQGVSKIRRKENKSMSADTYWSSETREVPIFRLVNAERECLI